MKKHWFKLSICVLWYVSLRLILHYNLDIKYLLYCNLTIIGLGIIDYVYDEFINENNEL